MWTNGILKGKLLINFKGSESRAKFKTEKINKNSEILFNRPSQRALKNKVLNRRKVIEKVLKQNQRKIKNKDKVKENSRDKFKTND